MRNTPTPWYKFNPPVDAADALKFGPICYPLTIDEANRTGRNYVTWFDWMTPVRWKGYDDERPAPIQRPARKFLQSSFDFSGAKA